MFFLHDMAYMHLSSLVIFPYSTFISNNNHILSLENDCARLYPLSFSMTIRLYINSRALYVRKKNKKCATKNQNFYARNRNATFVQQANFS